MAAANLKSSFISTQYILCGDERDHGDGRWLIVRSMYSFPTGSGKSGKFLMVLSSSSKFSSSGIKYVFCEENHVFWLSTVIGIQYK